jgi:putative hydrolase of the HAD superfamily
VSSSGFQVPGSKPEVVLFDAGGTLVLIDPDRFNALLTAFDLPVVAADRLAEAHFQAMSDYAYRLEAGEKLEFRWWVEHFFGLLDRPLSADMARVFSGGKGMWNYPITGARETVLDLQAGGYRVAVVSNSDGTVAEALNIAGFGGMFELVIDSTNVGVSKPDPAIFAVALERLGVAPDRAWYIGDSHYHDMGGARAAGLAAGVLIDPLALGPDGQLSVKSIGHLPDRLP